jgi:hypothetical protein
MKKLLLLIILLAGTGTLASAQVNSPVLNGDTVTYAGHRLYTNLRVTLLYGSKPDKSFAFAYSMIVDNQLAASHCNQTVLIKEFRKIDGKYYASGQLEKVTGLLNSKTCLIDIQAAIDWKEIQVE